MNQQKLINNKSHNDVTCQRYSIMQGNYTEYYSVYLLTKTLKYESRWVSRLPTLKILNICNFLFSQTVKDREKVSARAFWFVVSTYSTKHTMYYYPLISLLTLIELRTIWYILQYRPIIKHLKNNAQTPENFCERNISECLSKYQIWVLKDCNIYFEILLTYRTRSHHYW